jgi:O-antigen/teichoic acid export membrane protein
MLASLAMLSSGWVPRLAYSTSAVRELLGFSANLFGFNFINYWSRNVDNLLIGKLMGSGSLGVYSRAYSLMLMPITQVIRIVSRVMFPALASIQGDIVRVRRIYLRAVRMVAFVTFPMMAGLLAAADSFVVTVLGAHWQDVVPVLQILCGVGLIQTLCNPVGWIYQSQGRTDWLLRWGIAACGAIIVAIGIGASFGTVEAVALAYLLVNVLLLYPCLAIPGTLVGMRVRDVFGAISGVAISSLMMVVLVLGVGWLSAAVWPPAAVLIAQVATGMIAYVAVSVFMCKAVWEEVRALLVEWRRSGLGVASAPTESAAAVSGSQ